MDSTTVCAMMHVHTHDVAQALPHVLSLLPDVMTCGCRNLRVAELESQVAPRPMSRERPAMDGFKTALAPEDSTQSMVLMQNKSNYDMYY